MSKAKVVAGGALAAVLAAAGVLVARWEGVRYTPYLDVVGVPTVCVGHTGPDVVIGRKYTKAECDRFLQEDLAEANGYVRRCIARPMPERVEVALTSLVFNVGPGPVCAEGRQVRKWARQGAWDQTCQALTAYKYAGKRVVKGLVYRRMDEFRVCMGG